MLPRLSHRPVSWHAVVVVVVYHRPVVVVVVVRRRTKTAVAVHRHVVVAVDSFHRLEQGGELLSPSRSPF